MSAWRTWAESISRIGEYDGPPPVTITWSIGAGRSAEEPGQGILVGGVEGGRALRAQLLRGPVEPVLIAADEDDVGALGPGPPGRLQPDPRAAADHGDGLPGQFRLSPGGHAVAFGLSAICASIGVLGWGMSLMSMTRHCTAAP